MNNKVSKSYKNRASDYLAQTGKTYDYGMKVTPSEMMPKSKKVMTGSDLTAMQYKEYASCCK